MNPNEPFTNPNLDEPRTTIIMGSNSREAAEALNALAAIKALHSKGQAASRRYAVYDSCEYCDDAYGDPVPWPCTTARAWGEK